jgi:polyferredoxin
MNSILAPEEHVLSTLEHDGSRRWLYPTLSNGALYRWRLLVAYSLIAVFVLLPHLRIAGKPAVLLDLEARRFTIFGLTLHPTETLLLAFFMVTVFLSIFLMTAVFGRVWCGWACPQTVYLEFVFRPIERFFDNTIGRGGRPSRKLGGWRYFLRVIVYLILSMLLAHTFLAYFVGVEKLAVWITRSPFENPVSFLVMAITTGLMMFDFVYFREQLCTLACPYGRFQSVLLDRQSLVVSYDAIRGEPRGRLANAGAATSTVAANVAAETAKAESSPAGTPLAIVSSPSVSTAAVADTPAESKATGDCIDCGACVRTCPTGIDIRDGLQMECIHCTQCIDACDAIMDRIERPRGLIRYSSQAAIEGQPRKGFRPRLVVYPLLLIAAVTALTVAVIQRTSFDVAVLRTPGNPFNELPSGLVQNALRLKLMNRGDTKSTLTLVVIGSDDVALDLPSPVIELDPQAAVVVPVAFNAARESFVGGERTIQLEVSSATQERRVIALRLLGPWGRGLTMPRPASASSSSQPAASKPPEESAPADNPAESQP